MERQEELPAASAAVILTMFVPKSRGIEAFHEPVPPATPAYPEEVDHRTDVTPMLSVAVPATAILGADVETRVIAGYVIRSPGETLSEDDGGVEGVPGAPPPPDGGSVTPLGVP
jgi:hypothetical protein